MDHWSSPADFYLDGEPHLMPERMMNLLCEADGIEPRELGVRSTMIASFGPRQVSFIAEAAGATRIQRPTPATWPQVYAADDVGVVLMTIGAPAAVMAGEEMIALGMQSLIILGAAGSLQPDLPIGSVVLPERAIREEGTSHHYVAAGGPATAHPGLLAKLEVASANRGLQPRRGLHWTTDSMYREHLQKIERFRDAGVLTVDLEISALYTLAAHRDIECAAILVASDELYEPFRVGWRSPEFIENMGKAGLAALDVATGTVCSTTSGDH